MRALLPSALLLLAAALAAAGCAGPGGTAADPDGPPPRDFSLTVECEGAYNPHCDWTVAITGDGRVAYRVTHRGARPADRAGADRLSPEAVRSLWRSVAASGLFDLPPRLGPDPGQEERGVVTYAAAAAGRRAAVVSDRASHPGLDALLRTLFRVTPPRIWLPPSAP